MLILASTLAILSASADLRAHSTQAAVVIELPYKAYEQAAIQAMKHFLVPASYIGKEPDVLYATEAFSYTRNQKIALPTRALFVSSWANLLAAALNVHRARGRWLTGLRVPGENSAGCDSTRPS